MLAGWPLLLATVGHSAAASAQPMEVRASAHAGIARDLVGAGQQAFFGPGVDLLLFARRLEVGSGLRMLVGALTPEPAFAAFVASRLSVHHGAWAPALGVELELGSAHSNETPGEPPDSFTRAFNQAGSGGKLRGYVELDALRFAWKRVFLGAGAMRLGTPLGDAAGRRVRISLTLLRFGWEFTP